MKHHRLATAVLFTAAAFVLAGCDDNNGYCGYYCNTDPSGVYEGFATNQTTNVTTSVVAIIDENGDGTLSGQDGSYYRLSVWTSGNNLNGSYQGDTSGSITPTTGTISGQWTNGGLNLNLNGTGNRVVSTVLNYNNVYYKLQSSLPTLQGSWTTGATTYNGVTCASGVANCPPTGSTTLSLSFSNAGGITGSDSNSCTYSGNFELIYPQYNAYYEKFTQTCGSNAPDNFTGLASYFPASGSGSNAVPAQILFMADDGNGNYLSSLLQ